MSKSLKITLLILIIVGLIISGLLAWRWYSDDSEEVEKVPSTGEVIDISSGGELDLSAWKDLAGDDKVIDAGNFVQPSGVGVPLNDSEKVIADKAIAQQTARYFVEIFGSYSSDNNFQNLKDLQPLMSSTYWAKWEKDLATITSNTDYSVWSQAVNATLDSYSNTSAVVTVLCKRGERKSKSDRENIFYQHAQVNLVKVSNNWLVDKVVWLD